MAAPGDGTRVTAEALIAQRSAVLRARTEKKPPLSGLPGGFAISKRGHGQVVADSRMYIHGDDMRHLDRGATARTGELHIRTFHDERDKVTFLVADFRPSMLWGMRRAFRSVAAAEALAWIGWQAVEEGGRVGLLALTETAPVIVRTQGKLRGMLAVIGGLVDAHETALDAAMRAAGQGGEARLFRDPPLDRALSGLHRIVPRAASVVLASAMDSLGPGFDAVMGRLAQHRRPQILRIEDRALNDLPAGHYPIYGSDGTRRDAQFARPGQAEDRLPDYDIWRVDAGEPTRDAMIRAVAER
ncbi:DUF58 domain-containing protein [Roseovarius aestuarii]|uniref:DUF58 domain-containing protein n=1 Tax=Roseovarius aestuarii TaxID=475083 RepID=A0A1X7BXG2_9RHOB|nr:DUF58 domain-containing protein [Roseovarius aestuarii]SMC13949.1 hypothetical protein ROA7745_03811 [Roseovarius aestuarii]